MKLKHLLFGIKEKHIPGKIKYYIFGIPIWRVRYSEDTIRIYFLGIKVLNIPKNVVFANEYEILSKIDTENAELNMVKAFELLNSRFEHNYEGNE